MQLRDLGERETIRRLTAALHDSASVSVGPGDDAAVLRPAPGYELVVTTDLLLEGRHYLSEWMTQAEIGERLAAVNLSDLAAMAAAPRWALLSFGVRVDRTFESLEELQQGLVAALARDGAALVGGNLVAVEGPEFFSLTLCGEVESGAAWTRSGARPGDLLAVTGHPGRAGAGVALVRELGERARATDLAPVLEAWRAPQSRVALARALASAGVTAAIDVSDGLVGDLEQLCAMSGVGAEVDVAAFASDPALEHAARALSLSLETLRYGPSDDYELLLAVDPARQDACAKAAESFDAPLSFIGRITDAPGLLFEVGRGERRPLAAEGFDHFGGSAG